MTQTNELVSPINSLAGEGRFMRTIKRPDGGITYQYSYRDSDGKARNLQTTVYSKLQSEHTEAQHELVQKAKNNTKNTAGPLFADLVDCVVRKNNGGSTPWVYNAVKKALGKYPVNKEFVQRYNDYIDDMDENEYSHNTIQHHKSAIRRTLNYAYERGTLDSIPIRKWDISFEFRSRIWADEQERLKFFNKLIEKRSHLYWSMILLEKRPIRARSDLWRLTNDNLVLFGEGAPYLRYLAKKTDNEKNKEKKETFIPLRGLDDVLDYLKHGRPAGCDLLFPNVYLPPKHDIHDFEFMRTAKWRPMGKPKRHFNYICSECGIHDLHIHDFKHMAIKHMLEDENYTIEQLTAFGIQFDDKLIKQVYWQKNAIKMMSKNNDVVSDSVSVVKTGSDETPIK